MDDLERGRGVAPAGPSTAAEAEGDERAVEAALRPRTLDEVVGQERVREAAGAGARGGPARAAARPTTCCCPAPRARQDHAGDDHRRRDDARRCGSPAARRSPTPVTSRRSSPGSTRATCCSSTRSTGCRGRPRRCSTWRWRTSGSTSSSARGRARPPSRWRSRRSRWSARPPAPACCPGRCATGSGSPRTWSSTSRTTSTDRAPVRRAARRRRSPTEGAAEIALALPGHAPDRQPAAAAGPRLRPGARRRRRHPRRRPRGAGPLRGRRARPRPSRPGGARRALPPLRWRPGRRLAPWRSRSARSARPSRRWPSRSWSATASWPAPRAAGSPRRPPGQHLGLEAPPRAPETRRRRAAVRRLTAGSQAIHVSPDRARLHLRVGRPCQVLAVAAISLKLERFRRGRDRLPAATGGHRPAVLAPDHQACQPATEGPGPDAVGHQRGRGGHAHLRDLRHGDRDGRGPAVDSRSRPASLSGWPVALSGPSYRRSSPTTGTPTTPADDEPPTTSTPTGPTLHRRALDESTDGDDAAEERSNGEQEAPPGPHPDGLLPRRRVAYGLVALTAPGSPELGLDLQGGTRITLTAERRPRPRSSLDEARSIIDQRVNGSGVAEAEVTTQGGNQIVVEIPGKSRCETWWRPSSARRSCGSGWSRAATSPPVAPARRPAEPARPRARAHGRAAPRPPQSPQRPPVG